VFVRLVDWATAGKQGNDRHEVTVKQNDKSSTEGECMMQCRTTVEEDAMSVARKTAKCITQSVRGFDWRVVSVLH